MRTLVSLLTVVVFSFVACSNSNDQDADSGQLSGDCSLKIINGEECPKGEGPIALVVAESEDGIPLSMCSGTFITTKKILSAAHCGQLMDAPVTKVYTGNTVVKVSSFKAHPYYVNNAPYNFRYDVGIFTLEDSINISPLPLLLSRQPQVGDLIFVYGFGIDENNQTAIDNDWGNSVRRTSMLVSSLQNGGIVAEFDATHSGACEGDSGGPALAQSPQGSYGITGVVSGGTNDSCQVGTLEVFTEIAQDEVLNFILSEVPNVDAV
ncbi:MAG: trypsin-like serine protease [SAR324 cluster bacterium]|uniref:Trypsin-like serine protease n=1 Tax=SAR324 cluster bacterium TaxID=2024889 RepID=A0A7X9ILX5_9DELT|nr:trypsin-like serine protease [SAR324 cluster bacterium]